MANLIPRRRSSIPKPTPQPFIHSETRVSVPSSFFASCSKPFPPTLSVTRKKPNVCNFLWNFECEMKKWMALLNEKCSDSQNPLEAQQLFRQFRSRVNNAAVTIQDICCKNALDNLLKTIQSRILYLKNEPEHEAYTAFAERCAAAKAAEKSFLDWLFGNIDADLMKGILAEQKFVEASEKAEEVKGISEGVEGMDTDEEQKSVDEGNVVAEEDKVIQTEDSVDMKAWMANQEKVTAELQKSNEEIKSWMVN